MKIRFSTLPAVVLIASGLAFWHADVVAPAVAGDEVIAAAAVTMLPAGTDEYEYVGTNKCKKCHIKEYKSWKETRKAKTFDTLKPGEASEAKQKAKIDPAKDYTKDEGCLACHATGFGRPGGYFIPDPNDEKAVKKAKKLEAAGCESCHGPGSAYIKLFKEIKKSKRTYKIEELYAVGLTKIEAPVCTGCHNEKSPTYKPFNFEEQKDKGLHEILPLKQREE